VLISVVGKYPASLDPSQAKAARNNLAPNFNQVMDGLKRMPGLQVYFGRGEGSTIALDAVTFTPMDVQVIEIVVTGLPVRPEIRAALTAVIADTAHAAFGNEADLQVFDVADESRALTERRCRVHG